MDLRGLSWRYTPLLQLRAAFPSPDIQLIHPRLPDFCAKSDGMLKKVKFSMT
jgi:hypothetical protein